MIRQLLAALLVGGLMTDPASSSNRSVTILTYEDLASWESDDHAAALDVFLSTCRDLSDPDWQALCALGDHIGRQDPRAYFETLFVPVLIEDGNDGLFTGYFEPELSGALEPSEQYKYPVYRLPPEAENAEIWISREEIESGETMSDRGLEIAWVDDPVELFFLQIQGSGRIRLEDGTMLRVGYAGSNGHPYRSIGVELIRRNIYDAHQVSAQVIKNWVGRNPEEGMALLHHNPSYVFFREVNQVPPDKGPLGAMNRSVTKGRSIAVDPAFVPLGAPVWVEKDGADPLRRLMIAQDTGSAIKGAQRADIFFGTGDAAGREAGRLRDPGRMIVLLPLQRAYAMLPEDMQ